jgi:hypothetical protein
MDSDEGSGSIMIAGFRSLERPLLYLRTVTHTRTQARTLWIM